MGEGNTDNEEIMGSYGAGKRNMEDSMVVNFAKRMDLAIVNTYFKKKDKHSVAYKSGEKSTQIDYLMCRRRDLKEMCNCKVMVNERVAKRHAWWYTKSHDEKDKGRESKAKDKMVEIKEDKLSRSV